MRILIDIGHPAHVHLFKNLYFILKKKKHDLFITVKSNLESAKQLLLIYKIPFIPIGSKSDSIILKGVKQIVYDLSILLLIRKYKIDIGLGTSLNLAHASKLSGLKSIILDDDDDEVEPLFAKLAHPFCDVLLSPDSLKGKRAKKDTIYYPGFHELAYLHPKRFIPDVDILKEAGINQKEKYFVLRFNSFKAHHDIKSKGLSLSAKKELIDILKSKGKIFITTEREIESEFSNYQIKLTPDKIHSLLYYATMFIGDSQTMTSEAAILGTPAIRSNTFVGKISYLEEEEKYGLTYGFKPYHIREMFAKINELLTMPDLKKEWQERKRKMLSEKIDLTAFLDWFIENFPNSKDLIRQCPNIFREFS